MKGNGADPKANPAVNCTPIVGFRHEFANPEAERAAKAANTAWAIESSRLPYGSHLERLHALEAAGVIPDERYFDALAKAVPWS